MTFQIMGDTPGYFGNENPLGYSSPTTRFQIEEPERIFSIDPQEDTNVHQSSFLGENLGITHRVSYENISLDQVGSFRIHRPLKPHFPLKTQEKMKKWMRRPLRSSEKVSLIDEICIISADFYKVKSGKHIAVKIDGTIVESADSEIDLLLKIQGRQFGVPVFAYEVGAESSPGWST